MFVRAYLRASTDDQDASRARDALKAFAAEHDVRIAAFYVENVSGAVLNRPELLRLLSDAEPSDVLLVEAVDRLTRMDRKTWEQLREQISQAGLQVVALDVPLTHTALKPAAGEEGIQGWMLRALSQMFLEFMAAFARKDYDTRRERQAQGIRKAQASGLYKGRRPDLELRRKIEDCLGKGFSVRHTAQLLGCAPSTVTRHKNEKAAREQPVA
ncbi:recombinase family protein [Pseudomonas luteola]